MTNSKNVRVLGRLKEDLREVFGARIPVDTLGVVLGFRSGETLRQALKSTLKLTIHSDPQGGQPYVSTDELLKLLKVEHERAAWQRDNQTIEEVNMEK